MTQPLKYLDHGTVGRPRVGIVLHHPAPYYEPALGRVVERGNVDVEMIFLSARSDWHPYWRHSRKTTVPSRVLTPPQGPLGALRQALSLGRILHDARYDVLFICGYRELVMQAAVLRCIVSGTPLVLVADSVLLPRRPLAVRAIRYLPVRCLGALSSSFWVPGRASREYWVAYGVRNEKIFEGCYCLDSDAILANAANWRPKRRDLRAALGFGRDEFVFLFVGRMVPQRGLMDLFHAYDSLAEGEGRARLLIVGDGPLRDSLLQHRSTMRNPEHVILQAPVSFDDLVSYYVASDAYIQPSVGEPYSLSAAQAAILGLPVITTNVVGAAADYIIDRISGLQVPPSSPRRLANAMQECIQNMPLALSMGAGAALAAARRSPDWAAEQFEAATWSALGTGSPG